MLADPKLFEAVEQSLKERGIIEEFEEENGEIIGRMMITLGEIPNNLKEEVNIEEDDVVFIGTFDFYDASVGMVLNPFTMTAKSGLWITKHSENAEPPSDDWCNFFVKVIAENIDSNGNYSYPLFTFCSATGDFTVVPSAPDEE